MPATPIRRCATRLYGLVSILSLVAVPASAQDPSVAFREAMVAWNRGHYPVALTMFERVLRGDTASAWVDSIALVTGELFVSRELSLDGRSVRISADGRWVSYERGAGATGWLHLVRLDETGGVARRDSTRGTQLAFAPAGERVAFARVTTGPRPTRVVVRDLESGVEEVLADSSLTIASPTWDATGAQVYFLGRRAPSPAVHVFVWRAGRPAVASITSGDTLRADLSVAGNTLVYSLGRDGVQNPTGGATGSVVVRELSSGSERVFAGMQASIAANGSTVSWVERRGPEFLLYAWKPASGGEPQIVKRSLQPVANPAVSPDGSQIAFSLMPREDQELFVVSADGSNERRLTREIQHDWSPMWVAPSRILARMGEPRHTRSYLYDATSGVRTRLFHNNTVRTIAPEYEWVVSQDGRRVVIVSDRDGNTVSPERGVYLMDLERRVTREALLSRVRAQHSTEMALREKGNAIFAPIAQRVRTVTDSVSKERIYDYARNLYAFDSKHITRPGNALAISYLEQTYRSFGYDVELQWFEPRPGIRTANVVATLKGTVSPDLVYVVGSHFDSVAEGPGADDNSSGTTMLLETARVLARRPQPATIKFVSFTGEEAGLLGSREFVRRLRADSVRVAGVMNNDMMGWSNDERLDNTIRYSNPGIRDVQHAAALQFSGLITYDALYHRGTDATAFYEVYGDIVGGFGSYPVLGNPHYHRAHDVLETINFEQVTENTRANAATMMLLASSPGRLSGVTVTRNSSQATVVWQPALERDAIAYEVQWTTASGNVRTQRVTTPRITVAGLPEGAEVAVRAVNRAGLAGWDWARGR